MRKLGILIIVLVLIIGFANASTITTFTRTPSFVVDCKTDDEVSTVNNTFWNLTAEGCYPAVSQPSYIQRDFTLCSSTTCTPFFNYAYWWFYGTPDYPTSCGNSDGGAYIGKPCNMRNINSCRPSYDPYKGNFYCSNDNTCQVAINNLLEQPTDYLNHALNPAYFFVPKNSNVTFASMNITGLTFNGSLPSNITISLTGSAEYNYTLQLNSTVSPKNILLNMSKINSYLATCTSVQGNCSIPMLVTSSSGGVVRMENLNITYSDNFSRCGTFNENLTLYNNISTVNSSCLNLVANNIVLDCNGYSINYTGTQNEIEQNAYYGINATGGTGITIKNCSVSRFQEGISLTTTSSSLIQNNILTDNLHGIYSRGSSSNTFQNNQITNTLSSVFTTTGITLGQYTTTTASSNNVFNNTSIYIGSNRNGIYISSSTLDLQNNTFSNSLINSSGTNNSIGIYNNKHSYLNLFHNINFTGVFGSAIWFNGGTLNTLNASTISSGNLIDILSNTSSGSTPQNVILNSTFNASKFVFDTSSANLLSEWYLDVNVTNSTFGLVPNVTVAIESVYYPDYTTRTTKQFVTGANGKIGNQIINGQYFNVTGQFNYSTMINISSPNYVNANSTWLNLTSSVVQTLRLSNALLVRAYSNQTTYNASNSAIFSINITRLNGTAVSNLKVNLTAIYPNSTIMQSWNELTLDSNGYVSVQYTFGSMQPAGNYTLNATAYNSSFAFPETTNSSNFTIQRSYSYSNTPTVQTITIYQNQSTNTTIYLNNPALGGIGNQNITIYQASNTSWVQVVATKLLIVGTTTESSVFINTSGLANGTYAAKITFYDPLLNVTNSTTILTIIVSNVPAPNLQINTSLVSISVVRSQNYSVDVRLNNTGTANATGVNCSITNSMGLLNVSPLTIGNLTNKTSQILTLNWTVNSTISQGVYYSYLFCNSTQNSFYNTTIVTTYQVPELTVNPTSISKTILQGTIDTCSGSNPNLPCFNLQNIGQANATGVNCTTTGNWSAWVTSISPTSQTIAPSGLISMTYSVSIPAASTETAVIPIVCNSTNNAIDSTMTLTLQAYSIAAPIIPGGGGGTIITSTEIKVSCTPNKIETSMNIYTQKTFDLICQNNDDNKITMTATGLESYIKVQPIEQTIDAGKTGKFIAQITAQKDAVTKISFNLAKTGSTLSGRYEIPVKITLSSLVAGNLSFDLSSLIKNNFWAAVGLSAMLFLISGLVFINGEKNVSKSIFYLAIIALAVTLALGLT